MKENINFIYYVEKKETDINCVLADRTQLIYYEGEIDRQRYKQMND